MLFWRRRSVARVWYRSEGVLLHRKNLMLQCLIVWKQQKRLVKRQSPCFRKRCYLSRKGLHNCLFQTFFLFRKRHLKMEGCRLPLNWWKGLVHRYQSPSQKSALETAGSCSAVCFTSCILSASPATLDFLDIEVPPLSCDARISLLCAYYTIYFCQKQSFLQFLRK